MAYYLNMNSVLMSDMFQANVEAPLQFREEMLQVQYQNNCDEQNE